MCAFLDTDTLGYFPIRHGLAPSSMGLKRLPSYQESEKNKIFQFGNDWQDTLNNKKACRLERLGKYYQYSPTHAAEDICLWIIETLCRENSDFFAKHNIKSDRTFQLNCSHTGDVLAINNGRIDVDASAMKSFAPPPLDLFDALAMQVPEDLVVQACTQTYDQNHCARIHLCHANGWSAEWAVGKDFDEIHARIPRIKTIIRDSAKMLKAIVESSAPLERIGGVNFRTSPQLNRHPEIPEEERHVPFHHLNNNELYLRFERQCVVGFKEANEFLFTIRTYRTQISPQMPTEQWQAFVKCMEGTSDGTNPHRFLVTNRTELLSWLSAQESLG